MRAKRAGTSPYSLSLNFAQLFNCTGYFQPRNEVLIQPLKEQVQQLEAGEDRAVLCEGTVAGNSSVALQWGVCTTSCSELPRKVASLTGNPENVTTELCRGSKGVYTIPLQSFLGPSAENSLGPSGAIFLHLRAALLICGANSSSANSYSCFATNTSSAFKVTVTISISSSIQSYVVGAVVSIVVFTLFILAVIALICWRHYRSKRTDAAFMMPLSTLRQQQQQQRRQQQQRSNFVNPIFDVESSSPTSVTEFSRDQLRFISILGTRLQYSFSALDSLSLSPSLSPSLSLSLSLSLSFSLSFSLSPSLPPSLPLSCR